MAKAIGVEIVRKDGTTVTRSLDTAVAALNLVEREGVTIVDKEVEILKTGGVTATLTGFTFAGLLRLPSASKFRSTMGIEMPKADGEPKAKGKAKTTEPKGRKQKLAAKGEQTRKARKSAAA